jgi:3-carboxy-cis,cis-muconate cycloisomerase
MAELLNLVSTDEPWHVARDSLAELGFVLAAASATCAKLAREVIDLSRSEIGELREEVGFMRGASSTMPQKQNPITSESIVGLSISAQALVPPLLSAMQGGHERAAGEWHSEWDAVPLAFTYSAGALARTGELMSGLNVVRQRMSENIQAAGDLLMAEALMLRLAPALGRDEAHEVVYKACELARHDHIPLGQATRIVAQEAGLDDLSMVDAQLTPETYVGEAPYVVGYAIEAWRDRAL